MSALKYRSDIDGIRAIAVLSVMMFHAGIELFAGGYVGVDIFFVISGYLITKILITEIEDNRFSLINFYERRTRRIIPALIFMILVTTPIFYWILLPDDLENFGQSIVATILFSNNVLLWLTSGYFESATELKPLSHTWSLGVEEQFYLFAPLLLLASYRIWSHRGIIYAMGVVFATSLIFCLIASSVSPDANFYLIFSRIWEIGAGSIAATQGAASLRERVSPTTGAWISNTALVFILGSGYFYGFSRTNPDIFTVAVIGAVFAVILFNRNEFWAHRFLSNRFFLFIGALSYSLYLWHQPIYVFIRVTSLEEPSVIIFGIGALVAFAMAYLSWRFVEQPFRRRETMPVKRLYVITGLTSLVAMAAGLAMHFTSGFYNRWPELAQADRGFSKNMNIAFNEAPYRFIDTQFDPKAGGRKILVIGNSFARDFINMVEVTGRLTGNQLVYSDAKMCDVLTRPNGLTDKIAMADFVVLATKPDAENIPCMRDIRNIVRAKSGAQFIVMGTKNFGWNNNAIMLLPAQQRYTYYARVVDEYSLSNDLGRSSFPENEYVNILAAISDRPGMVPVFTPDRKFISQDREHLTPAGAKYVGDAIFRLAPLSAIRPS